MTKPTLSFQITGVGAAKFAETLAEQLRDQIAVKVKGVLDKVVAKALKLYPVSHYDMAVQRDGSETHYAIVRNGSEVIAALTVSMYHDEVRYIVKCKKELEITAEDLK